MATGAQRSQSLDDSLWPVPPVAMLFLRQRFVESGNDRRALLLPGPGFVFFAGRGRGGASGRRLRVVQRQAGREAPDLVGVEHFTRQEGVGHLDQRVLVGAEKLVRALIVLRDEALHLVVDLERRV